MAAPHPKQGLSDLNLNFKKDRQITHNSMFADYLSSSTDSFIRNPRPNCQRSIIPSGTRQYPTLVKSDQNRLVSSQEKNTNPTQGDGPLSRDSQDMESAQSVNKKIHRIFASIFGSVHASLADPLTLSFLLRFLNHVPYV